MKRYIVPALAIIWILSGPLSGPAVGEVPGLINYQGKLTDELGSPVNRETEISFAIYTEASGGGAIWSEVQNVTVTDGIFNVLLGSVNSLSSGYFETEDEVYLGVAVGSDQEMAPRQKIASAAFALRAEISDRAKDLTSSGRISLLEAVYPVGSIYISIVNTNPAALFGFGTWTAFGAGRVPVGYNAGDGDFNSAEKTGGAKTHTLTINEIPSHTHNYWFFECNPILSPNNQGGGRAIDPLNRWTDNTGRIHSTGGGGAHNNLQPYIVVYMWKRTG